MVVVWGTNNSETLDAADGVTNSADTILGLDGNDIIHGLKGNDYLKGGGGADTLYGGDGSDTAFYDDSPSAVYIDLYLDQAGGGTATGDNLNSIENLWGSNYDDYLYGTTGDNVLTGSLGNDYLVGSYGSDTLDGGDGTDTIAFWNHDGALTVNLATGVAITEVGTDTLIGIENVKRSSKRRHHHRQ